MPQAVTKPVKGRAINLGVFDPKHVVFFAFHRAHMNCVYISKDLGERPGEQKPRVKHLP